MKSTLLKSVFFPNGAKFSAFKHHFHDDMGLPRPRLSPHHFLSIFGIILSYFKIKIKKKMKWIKNSLYSKQDSFNSVPKQSTAEEKKKIKPWWLKGKATNVEKVKIPKKTHQCFWLSF